MHVILGWTEILQYVSSDRYGVMISAATLILILPDSKERQRLIRAEFPESPGLRVHRAISWLGRAEQMGDDHDVRFILSWVSFNAAYP